LNDRINLMADVEIDLTIVKLSRHLSPGSRDLRSQKQSKMQPNNIEQKCNIISEQHPPTHNGPRGRSYHRYALTPRPIQSAKSQHPKISKNSQKHTKRLQNDSVTVD